MLVESSFSASLETSLHNASEYQDPFAAYDWMSLAETYQMIHKLPEQSQVSFLDAVIVPDAMKLDESEEHPKLQVSCPEQNVTHKVSEKALTSLVYSRRKKSVRPGGSEEHSPGKNLDETFDDSIVPVYNPGESSKRKNRFNNCLVYSRKKKRGETSSVTGETIIRTDGIDDAFVSVHDCRESKRRANVCLVYSLRKKGGVKSNSCAFSEHVSRGTKISGNQADSSECIRRVQILKADGGFTGSNPEEIKNSGPRHLYSQSKPLLKSNGSFAECHTWGTKRIGDTSNGLLMYSRRKQRGKSIGARINGFLVYRRKKTKANSISHAEQMCRSLELKSVGARVNGFLVYRRKKLKPNSISHVASSSDGTNDSCSSQSSSELASGSSKNGENEATDCDSSDTEGSISPFRQCKRCDKAGIVEKMLICDECEEAYHPRCCRVRVKEAAEMDDWVCRSCLKKKKLSKTKIKGRSRERKWRVTGPFVIGIRVGKEFQADVPDWSGPTMSDTSFVGEPLEIDESEYMNDLKKGKNGKKPRSAENWLQCREEDRNGDICGKWRRGPRSEIQTSKWECFCSVFWDPLHADCAVPQELETDEIMKQLKYINMLRPRSEVKTQKIGPKGGSRSHK